MHVKEVILDGFKSYAHRTVVENFDKAFNAITGLNGSGKSNILDAICFVLGISVLSQVRVTSLQELIYKQGQAGVTKASVTIVFNNQDKSEGQCPVGYEDIPEITITRQIVMGGKNKYMINGKLVQQKQVQDLFQSVQLNVNNPHFLIMQGRITKVLNMKPPEILGLMEEAAGTRMFESKKIQARKTIEKKDKKLQEINQIMDSEIKPKLDRLQKQRSDFEAYQKNEVVLEELNRYVKAATYTRNKTAMAKKQADLEKNKAKVEACHEGIRDAQMEQKRLEQELKKLKERLEKDAANTSSDLEAKERHLSNVHVMHKARLEHRQKDIDAEAAKIASFHAEGAECTKAIKAKEKEKAQVEKVHQDLMEKVEKASQGLRNAENQLQLLQSGVAAGDNGQSLTEQLMELNQKISTAKADIKAHEMRIKFLHKSMKEKQAASQKQDTLFAETSARLQSAEKQLQAVQAKARGLGFDEGAATDCQRELDTLAKQERALKHEIGNMEDRISSLKFDYRDPWAGFDRSAVKGLVANLIDVRDKAHNTAIEVTAGGRLYNVVVDTEKTGAALLQSGGLKRRVTIIPLNKIQASMVDAGRQQRAQQISHGSASVALELIGYDPEVEAAMKYVFGRTFVCPDGDTAAKVAYDRQIECKTVTLGGDEYSPAGTMTGGAKGNLGNTLVVLQSLNDKRAELAAVRQRLQQLSHQSQQLSANRAKYQAISEEQESRAAEVEQLKQRLARSDHQQNLADLDNMRKEVGDLEGQVGEKQAFVQESEKQVKEIEAETREFKGGQDKGKKVEGEIQRLKKEVDKLRPQLAQKEQDLHRIVLELQDAVAEAKEEGKQMEEKAAALEAMKGELQQMQADVQQKEAEWQKAKAALDAANELLRKENEALSSKGEELEKVQGREEQLNRELKGLDHSAQQLKKEVAGYEAHNRQLVHDEQWIPQNEHLFGVRDTEFDFSKRDLKRAAAELDTLRTEQRDRQKTINKKAVQMYDKVEQDYRDLVDKKEQVKKDKRTIEHVIAELDDKKKQQLKDTHTKVNRDFNSMFSMLLPGAHAQLVAEKDEEGNLSGLEVRVAFNNQWKEGLSELSGGQRSLLALALILALLLFKPAPMYILDEVDAALDLSHTQNIGKIIKEHFKNSQFIVVSLKEGMFNNANVVFRTKFVNGQSTVQRTQNA